MKILPFPWSTFIVPRNSAACVVLKCIVTSVYILSSVSFPMIEIPVLN